MKKSAALLHGPVSSYFSDKGDTNRLGMVACKGLVETTLRVFFFFAITAANSAKIQQQWALVALNCGGLVETTTRVSFFFDLAAVDSAKI
jgi:hypothetical protein